jgi:hypothetical protein
VAFRPSAHLFGVAGATPSVSDYWNESDSFNNPKESQRQIALPRRFFGIDLVHTVEFSRIGRSELSLFRDCVQAFRLPTQLSVSAWEISLDQSDAVKRWTFSLVHSVPPGNQVSLP